MSTHDPYLMTIKRTLNEEKIKIRQNKIKSTKEKPKSFLAKKIILSEYIYLPESLQNLFLLTLFMIIPYAFGMIILFIILKYEEFKNYTTLSFDRAMLTWTVGYESIALILLLLIIKSAFIFKKK